MCILLASHNHAHAAYHLCQVYDIPIKVRHSPLACLADQVIFSSDSAVKEVKEGSAGLANYAVRSNPEKGGSQMEVLGWAGWSRQPLAVWEPGDREGQREG